MENQSFSKQKKTQRFKKRNFDQITQDESGFNVKQSSKIKTRSKKMLRHGDLSKEKNTVRSIPNDKKVNHSATVAASSKVRLPLNSMENSNTPRATQPISRNKLQEKTSINEKASPTKIKVNPRRDIKLDKTRPSMQDSSAFQSMKGDFGNKTLISIPQADLIDEASSPLKGRRSASCGSNDVSPSFGPEISELNACSFKSDQASIADWLELFGKNEFQFDCDGGEPIEEFFKLVNSEQLVCQTARPELVMVEEDSQHAVLNQAFIMEHSQMNVQGPSLLDEADCLPTLTNIGSFSITAMLNKSSPHMGRRTQNAKKDASDPADQEERKDN